MLKIPIFAGNSFAGLNKLPDFLFITLKFEITTMSKYRLFLSTLILFLLSSSGYSQYNYYKLWFSGKDSSYDVSRPSEFLSSKALERRLIQQIPVVESDLPVNRAFISEIKNSGAEVVYISKWLNMAIVKTDAQTFNNKISRFSFVKKYQSADHLFTQRSLSKSKSHFDKEMIEKLSARALRASHKTLSGSYNYGASANQVEMIGIHHLHEMGFNGQGIMIGVIDAGYNSVNTHPAFDSLRLNGQILGTRDFVQPGNDVYSTSINSHGTMVLSTMGGNLPGQLIGTAPKASYWLLRSEDATAEYLLEEYYWVNAAEFADSVGVDIINSSLGYSLFDNPAENHSYADMDGNTTVVTIGADMAAAKGILVVNSAGNSGGNAWQYITAPADGDSVFTIGAVDPAGLYAYFSSQGPTSDGRTKPDVSAQGISTIVATVPTGIAGGNGTSFSSPLIAGASACLWQANPTLSNMELMAAIKGSATKSGNPDNFLGWGIPDFNQANNILSTNLIRYSSAISELRVYPNPFTNQLNIELNADRSLKVDIQLISSSGVVSATLKQITLEAGKNKLELKNLGKLSPGMYMLQVFDGNTIIGEKVIR